MMSRLVALVVLLFTVATMAVDYRLTLKPASGQTVEEFCAVFTTTCPGVVAASQPNATVYQVCEQAPQAGIANADCVADENGAITAYTLQVAADLGATQV
ncbi:hypothetical protein BGW37DRAFT_498270 [Umbelopsis sp. PMI_123]|nr:hypothetical protein BGW37DRAFT_498270 [Umbelopsis sp. PMI_123]